MNPTISPAPCQPVTDLDAAGQGQDHGPYGGVALMIPAVEIDGLLGHREQQIRDRVGEQRRHRDMRPAAASAAALPAGQHGGKQQPPALGASRARVTSTGTSWRIAG